MKQTSQTELHGEDNWKKQVKIYQQQLRQERKLVFETGEQHQQQHPMKEEH